MKFWGAFFLWALVVRMAHGFDIRGSRKDAAKNTVTPSDGFKLACPKEEYERYYTIVCSENLQKCTSDWCHTYKHDWVKKFGACSAHGCEEVVFEKKE